MTNFHPIALLIITFFFVAFKQSEAVAQQSDLIQILDVNLDDTIDPYEALDVLLTIQQKDEKDLSVGISLKIKLHSMLQFCTIILE